MKIIDYLVDSNKEIILKEENCNTFNVIGTTSVGLNGPRIVDINGVTGFLKFSENTTNTFDMFEYLISKLGKYLNVKMADEYLVDEDGKLMLFSKSVIEKDEKLIMSSDIYKELFNTNRKTEEELRNFNKPIEEFKKSLLSANSDKKYGYIIDDSQIEFAINIFIEKVKLFQLPNEDEIIKDYIKMCFFDALIGNKDRNDNNFGLVKKDDESYTMAPLFDSSTLSVPGIPNNLCRIGDYCIDSKALATYLLKTYPDYINEMLISNVDDINSVLTQMSEQLLNEKQLEWFKTVILNRLNQENIDMLKTQEYQK